MSPLQPISEQPLCTICQEEYTSEDMLETAHVIKLICTHLFHINCLSSWMQRLQQNNDKLTCPICRHTYAEATTPSLVALRDSHVFNTILQNLRTSYEYDTEALAILTELENLYPEFVEITKNLRPIPNLTSLLKAVWILVQNHKKINPAVRQEVLAAFKTILICRTGCLRSLQQEAIRWRDTPLANFPEKMTNEGVLVHINSAIFCVPADYIYNTIQTMWSTKFNPEKAAIGGKRLAQWLGNVGTVLPLPRDIAQVLRQPCPFTPGKLVGDTNRLIRVPSILGGQDFSIARLQALLKHLKIFYDDPSIKEILKNITISESYWILVLINPIPGSSGATFEEQKKLIQEKGEKDGYTFPTITEAIMYAVTKCFLLLPSSRGPSWHYTRCQEAAPVDASKKERSSVIVGGISSEGLMVSTDTFNSRYERNISVVPVRRFFEQKCIFGNDDWAEYMNDAEQFPLPQGLLRFLQEQCSFNPTLRITDSHIVVLVPPILKGQNFSLNAFKAFLQDLKGNDGAKFAYYAAAVQLALGNITISKPYWMAITKDAIPGSKGMTLEQQKQLIQEKGGKSNYEQASAIDVVVSTAMYYHKTGNRLHKTGSYIRCKETVPLNSISNNQASVIVGNFGTSGLWLFAQLIKSTSLTERSNHGVVAVRKFFVN